MLLCVIFSIDSALWAWCYHFERRIADYDGEAEGEIKHATLAAVLETGACETNICALASCCAVRFPLEYSKRSCANLAFFIEKLAKFSRKTANKLSPESEASSLE
jgi:hypothetical protein